MDSRDGLPPWVSNGKALVGPGMKASGYRKLGVGDLRDPCPRHLVLLAPPPKRATPEVRYVVAKCAECPGVRGHRVVREEAYDHLLEPSPLFGMGSCMRARNGTLIFCGFSFSFR